MSETIEPTTETGTALAVIRTALPTILAADQNDILGKLADKVKSFRGDISTAKGRDAIRSLAAEIASSKMTLIKLGKSLTADWRDKTKAVNAECNIIEEKMDALKEQVRRPLTEFENAEKNRIAGHEAALADLLSFGSIPADWPSGHISTRIDELENYPGREWQEFNDRASDAYAQVSDKLRNAHTVAINREAEAAELAHLRAEQAERDRIAALQAKAEHEARIAAEAAEAARIEAEAKAERAAQKAAADALRAHQEAERKAQEERDAAAERERQAAEALADAQRQAEQEREVARQVEARAKAARTQAHQDALETMRRLAEPLTPPDPVAVIDAKRDRLADVYDRDWQEYGTEAGDLFEAGKATLATARANSVRIAEEAEVKRQAAVLERQEREKAAAVEAERQRVAHEEATRKADEDRRASNEAHRRKINREALTDISAAITIAKNAAFPNELSADDLAKVVVTATAKGDVRHMLMVY